MNTLFIHNVLNVELTDCRREKNNRTEREYDVINLIVISEINGKPHEFELTMLGNFDQTISVSAIS